MPRSIERFYRNTDRFEKQIERESNIRHMPRSIERFYRNTDRLEKQIERDLYPNR